MKQSFILCSIVFAVSVFIAVTQGTLNSDLDSKYKVHFYNHMKSLPPGNLVTMLTKDGREYQCSVPSETKPNSEKRTPDLSPEALRDTIVSTIQDSLEDQCLVRETGWWTYEFCYGVSAKQYHAAEKKRVVEYEAGSAPVLSKTSAPLSKEDVVKYFSSPSVSYRIPYYSEKYENGSDENCDGKKRTTEVRYFCTNERTTMFALNEEPATCSYIFGINVGAICEIPGFEIPVTTVQEIACKEVLDVNVAKALGK
eukprot:TRINITY_DN11775_c0_g1_i1.p1 TRINITY_DN11775_c0_g1~~TRINITY_DN11775_c0_g1_i1.p1  ORF type:complete len:254 (+),score=72.30 TRINITY_DN11775_c0_g1_i1:60-821(+)